MSPEKQLRLNRCADLELASERRIDGQGIALLLIAAVLAFGLGAAALWIGLR
jgi:hypothetical protein